MTSKSCKRSNEECAVLVRFGLFMSNHKTCTWWLATFINQSMPPIHFEFQQLTGTIHILFFISFPYPIPILSQHGRNSFHQCNCWNIKLCPKLGTASGTAAHHKQHAGLTSETTTNTNCPSNRTAVDSTGWSVQNYPQQVPQKKNRALPRKSYQMKGAKNRNDI